MKNLDELAMEAAKKLDIDQDAALDIAEHYLQQMETEDGKKIDREQISTDDVEFLLVAMWNAKKGWRPRGARATGFRGLHGGGG
ncbi:hypothetical protein NY053_05265 [Corynebacterium diphtheriae bv. mitis]|nr:hypothetical protein NY053_05265 [Corynebacterium diphtheriae bv. mitis]UWE87779.1 hypothetical protein NY054_10375 [Corynebacterium diphtheriae bv. mitis]UWE92963.1 hypothetical protein NY044_05260 [Corynebacterium diphtheriae bv. mitis]